MLQGGDFPWFNLKKLRIPGVLQRIAVVYFIVSITMLFAPTIDLKRIDDWINTHGRKFTKHLEYVFFKNIYKLLTIRFTIGSTGIFAVLIRYLMTWGVALLIIIVDLILTFAVYVPNCG